MKVSIFQPYLFPYIGYFQLINTADIFVIYDDVQYIKNGWINRNNILIGNKKNLFSFGVSKDHHEKFINQRFYTNSINKDKKKLLDKINYSYKKAPFYNATFNLIEEILQNEEKNVSAFNSFSLKKICEYLMINTKMVFSSDLDYNKTLKGEDRVISICKMLKGSEYVNSIGGTNLYNEKKFNEANLNLSFLKPSDCKYRQFKSEFIPYLSIIDIIMFNSVGEIKSMLKDFNLFNSMNELIIIK